MAIFHRNVCLPQRVRLHSVLILALASLLLGKPCPLELKMSGLKTAIFLSSRLEAATIQGEEMDINKIKWLGHASFRLEGEKIVYIDPWKISQGAQAADIVLITHTHYDHCSPEDVQRISKKETVIVVPADGANKFKKSVISLGPGESKDIEGIKVEAVPAYNINKSYHPRSENWVGYIVTLDGQRIYYAGDSDAIPEMENLKVDIALLPVGGTYTMDAQEAAAIVNKMKPGLTIPMHFGTIVGSLAEAEKFSRLSKVPVKILEKGE